MSITAVALAASTTLVRASADDTGLDQARYGAASARAALHWKTGGYDVLPQAFDEQTIERDKDTSMVAFLANQLLQSNPEKRPAVVDYINNAILPFILAHRAQFECILAEDYYNMTGIPTGQLASFGESPLINYLDASYLFLGTEKARRDAEIALPDDDSLRSAMSYVRENGWSNPTNKNHFNCAA